MFRMNIRTAAFATTIATLLGGLVATAANAQPFTYRSSGTFLETAFDSNGDGEEADHTFGRSKGTLGSHVSQGMVEFGPLVFPGIGCPNPFMDLRAPLVEAARVQTFNDLAQLFLELDPSSALVCILNFGAGPPFVATFVVPGTITGGTGRFEGATGSFVTEGTTNLDVAGDVSVSSSTTAGTLVLP